MSVAKYGLISAMVLLTACQKQADAPPEAAAPKAQPSSAALSEVPTASTTGATVIVAQTPATLPAPPVQVQQMDVPIYIEGISALLHPIVTVVKDNKNPTNKLSIGNDSENAKESGLETSLQSTYFNKTGLFDYQTNIDNLVFENLGNKTSQRLFAHNNFKIRRVFFPFIAKNNRLFNDNKIYTPNTPATLSKDKNKKPTSTVSPSAASHDNVSVNQRFILNPVKVDEVEYMALPRVIFEVNEANQATDTQKADNQKTDTQKTDTQKMALYMSDNFGHGITRLHPANQFLISSEWVEALQRFYFITQADSDSNGVINDKDQTFYYYIDFSTSMPTIQSYRF